MKHLPDPQPKKDAFSRSRSPLESLQVDPVGSTPVTSKGELTSVRVQDVCEAGREIRLHSRVGLKGWLERRSPYMHSTVPGTTRNCDRIIK